MELKNRHRPDRVTEAREAAGLTQTQVAEALACSLSLVSEIESGRKNITPERLASLAQVLGVPLEHLASEKYLREKPGSAA